MLKNQPPAVRRWMQVWLAFFLVLAAYGVPASPVGVTVQAQAAQPAPRFEPAPCMVEFPAGVQEGQQVNCGYLIVPEQYANPDGPTLRLAVVIIKSISPDPEPDPLVIMQGGPGGSTVEDYSLALFTNPRILPGVNRDMVLFDQRGTKHSEPFLSCSEVDQYTIDTLDENLSDEESERLYIEALTKCRERLVASGVNLSAFDTFENASDVEALRQALGYEQINLYGVSYGTLLALTVMRQSPQGLRSVIIDSVVPPQQNFITETVQSESRSFRKLFDTCAADPNCNEAYPNLEKVFYELADQLNEKPAEIQLTDSSSGQIYPTVFNGDALISTLFQMLYSTDLIPLLPGVIYDARAGNYALIERILSLVVFDFNVSLGMYYSVLCAEDADFTPQEMDLNNVPPQILDMEKNSADSFLKTCRLWNVEPLGPSADEPVVSDVPTLVLAGEFDPITPPAFAQLAVEGLSNSYFFTFPAGGHGAMMSGECQDAIILAFLNNPGREPDSSCIAEKQAPEYLTPGSLVRLPVLMRLLNLQGNSKLELVLFGLGLLFLLSAFVVYPVVWLVRLFTAKPKPAAPAQSWDAAQVPPGGLEPAGEPSQPAKQRPLTWRLAPVVALAAAGLLAIFSIILVVIVLSLAIQNDMRILVGLPGAAAPLFILPVLVLALAIGMLLLGAAAWLRGWGSIWGRLYFSMLSLSVLLVLGVLGSWGMLTALL